MKKIILAALVAAALFTSCAPAPAKKLVVAQDTTFPPMEYLDDSKAQVGFDVDLMNAVAKEAKLDLEFKSVSWDGIFAGVQNGTYDIIASSVTITDERQKTLDFSTPYINAGQVLVVLADNTKDTKLADFVGRNVGAQVNTTGSMEVDKVKGAKLKAYDDIALSFDDLVSKRVDAVVIDGPVAALYLKNAKFAGKIKIVGEPMTSEFYGIVVKKGNKELLDKINAALATLTTNGTLEQLKAKWLK
ncbi:MAG TPA: basic amino acid ABC transporter substrate-binding protein [Spirochaetia bacterium]|nr:basic amino acid ABC transporter substrate-binding protein [Spirochaetia bacterium]